MKLPPHLTDWLTQARTTTTSPAVRRWSPLVVFIAALVVATPWLRPLSAPRFTQSAPLPALPQHKPSPLARQDIPAPTPAVHSASLARLGPGRIAAAWFGGSREGAADVNIFLSVFNGQDWSVPQAILSRQRVERDTLRLIRKLGNPVLWHDGHGTLHLWFVSVSYGGWAGSALNHTTSVDGGLTWRKVQRLVTSPFWNISTLGHSPPLPLADGGLALPIYHEFIAKRPEWLRLDSHGQPVDKGRIPAAQRSLQPTVVSDGQQALMLLRDSSAAHRIRTARSEDGGRHWSPAQATALPNPDAGIALLKLADGSLLLAYNPQESNRTRLALSLSVDGGQSWSEPHLIEHGSGQDEFSYPALLQDDQGRIHLAYTWKREKIAHVSFHPGWLKQLRGIN